MMLFRLKGILLLFVVAATAAMAAPPTPIIKVDASTLGAGPQTTLTNAGSLGGSFSAVGVQTPYVETIAGKKAITFNGSNGYKASFTSPAGVTGTNPWSISTWIYNPTIGTDNDFYFMWAKRKSSGDTDGRCGELCYMNSGYGAAPHNGNWDMDWGRLGTPPTAGQWHNVTVTYDGAAATSTEIVYVDGVAVNVNVGKPLNIFPDCQVLLGCDEQTIYAVNDSKGSGSNWQKNGLSGSIASLQMWSSALSSDDVVSLAGGQNLPQALVSAGTPMLANASFEDYVFSGNQRGDRNAGSSGWRAFSRQGKTQPDNLYNMNVHQAHRSTSVWNNGMQVDGGQVVGLETAPPESVWLCQPLWGAKPNTQYKVWAYAGARYMNDNTGLLQFKVDGVNVLSTPAQIQPKDAQNTYATPFERVEGTFTTNAGANHVFAFGNVPVAGAKNNELLVDKVQVAEVGGPAVPVFSTTELPKVTSLDFGGVPAGMSLTKTFKLVNDGGRDMKITGIATIGPDGYNYTPSFSAGTVAPYGGASDISVTFSPTAAGSFNNVQLKIDTDSPVGSLYLPITGFSVPAVTNGSFEQIYINTGGGDYQPSYPGWNTNATVGNIGFSYNKNWKWDNGNFADGRQAAVLNRNTSDDTTTTMGQVIPGFVKGHTYRFRFFANSWKGTTSNAYDGKVMADFKVNGVSARGVKQSGSASATVNFPTNITSLEAGGSYTKTYDKYEYDWTAPDNGAYPIEFGAVGDAASDKQNGLLLDNVGVFDTAVAGPATVNTAKLDFGNRAINTTATLSVTVTNAGGKDLKVTGATISGGQAGAFARGTTLPLTVGAFNGSAGVSVNFLNTSYGQQDSTLTLVCDSGETFIVALTANTTFAAYAPMLSNGSLENSTLNKPTADNNNNAASGWYWSTPNTNQNGRSMAGAMYNNNGIDPDGGAAAWMRKGVADTTVSLYQDVAGFRAGHTYRISLYANPSATNGTTLPVDGTAHLVVTVGTTAGSNLVNVIDQASISAVNAVGVFTTPWQKFTGDYTAPSDGSMRLYVRAGMNSSDNGLCVDGVTIQEVGPSLQASPASVRLNTVNWYKNEAPTSATITLTNAGLSTLNLTGGATGTPGLAIVGSNLPTAQFSIVGTTPASKSSLAAGESMTVLVQFKPTYKGNYTATAALRVTSNDPNLPTLDIPLAGDGVPVELSTFSAE